MGSPGQPTQSDPTGNGTAEHARSERLDSWKEIAAYLRCSERTVRRWEQEGLPVHRHTHKKKSAIYAYRAEVDEWWQNGRERLQDLEKAESETAPGVRASVPGNRKRIILILAVSVLSFAVLGTIALRDRRPVPQAGRFLKLTNDAKDKSGNISIGIPSPIVTDGTRLFFVEPRGEAGLFQLAQISISGGETMFIPTPLQNIRLADISPDRTQLLLGNVTGPTAIEVPFYSVPTVGGSAQRLGDFLAHDASWSPDGQRLAYATGESLYVAKADGTEGKELMSGRGAVWRPRWSPEGKRLRFTITDAKTQDNSLWEISADGSHLHELSQDWDVPGEHCCGSWLPGGEYFAFQVSQLGVTTIWTVRENNPPWEKARPQQLTAGPISATAPTSSPDGKLIYVIGGQPRTEAIRYESGEKRFESFLPNSSVDSLEFTKDGKWVAYSQFPEGTLWRARSDGSERVQLTSGPFFATRPRWSPDGSRIVFFAQRPHRPWKLYLLAANGGAPEQLIAGDANEGDPSWSADGKKLVFGRLPWLAGAPERPELYVLDLASKQTNSVPQSEGLFSPRWSPSGRYIAALSADSSKVMLYDCESTKWRQLAKGNLGNPEWSQDGEYVYAIDVQGNAVVRIRISDGAMEKIANLNAERIAFTSMGPWTGLGPDNAVLATRDLSTQEIYAVELTK